MKTAHTFKSMKKRFLFLAVICLLLILLPACEIRRDSTLKEVTRPYINEYELVEGKFGDKDLLEDFDYVKIVFIDAHNYEAHIKPKKIAKKIIKGTYSVDAKTRELTTEEGILGFKLKEKVYIRNGGFTVSTIIFHKTLYLKFES